MEINSAVRPQRAVAIATSKVWVVRVAATATSIALLAISTPLIWAAVSSGLGVIALVTIGGQIESLSQMVAERRLGDPAQVLERQTRALARVWRISTKSTWVACRRLRQRCRLFAIRSRKKCSSGSLRRPGRWSWPRSTRAR
jgi:hypothetical protein